MSTSYFIVRSQGTAAQASSGGATAPSRLSAASVSNATGAYSAFTRLSAKPEPSRAAEQAAPPEAKKSWFAGAIGGAKKTKPQRAVKAARLPIIRSEKVIEDTTQAFAEQRAPRGRILALSGLCVLLVLSGAWAAMNRNAVNTVNLPINITRTQQPQIQTPQTTKEPQSAVNIEDIPMQEPTAASLGSFATYKVEMDAVRDQAIRMLDAILADEKADTATANAAFEEKLALAKAMTSEAALEGLTAARGYGESYITVKSGSVNVVVKNPSLTEAQMASLVEMIAAETGESPENVKVILTK